MSVAGIILHIMRVLFRMFFPVSWSVSHVFSRSIFSNSFILLHVHIPLPLHHPLKKSISYNFLIFVNSYNVIIIYRFLCLFLFHWFTYVCCSRIHCHWSYSCVRFEIMYCGYFIIAFWKNSFVLFRERLCSPFEFRIVLL